MDSTKEEQDLIQQVDDMSLSSSSTEEHPLQKPTVVVQEVATFVDDRALLDDQGRPNVSRTPSAIVELDTDTSHAKVRFHVTLLKRLYNLTLITYL